MSSRGVNKVILIGNLGQDPEIRTFGSGDQVANFSVATSETWQDRNTGERKEKTEWHRCVAYRKLAEIIGQYVRKGSKIYIEGRLQTRQWQDQNSQMRYVTEIVVDQMQMLDSRGGSTQNYAQAAPIEEKYHQTLPQQPAIPQGEFGPDPDVGFDDDEIPF